MARQTITRKPTDLEIAYLAGIFDGEGMVSISRKQRGVRQNDCYQLWIEVSNSSKCLMDWIVGHFGGYLIAQPKPTGNAHWKWVRRNIKAQGILEALLPFLTVKLDQARVGIEFQIRQSSEKKTYEAGRRGPIPRTPEQMAYKEDAKQMLHAMKRGGGALRNVAFIPWTKPQISTECRPANMKLSDEQVQEIRADYVRYGETPQRVLAERYGVSRGLIANIVRGFARKEREPQVSENQ